MSFPPEAYLIGAQKAGTTSLATLLDQHPDITLSRPKEAAFFTRNWWLGLDWYRSRFPDETGAIFLDATPAYANAPTDEFPQAPGFGESPYVGVPERIHSVNPKAKFIYVLRDPVTRTYSAYWHRVRQREEKLGFREAISSNPSYLRASDYYGQIQNYLEYFPLESFLFIVFEEMIEDFASAVQGCCALLGVDPAPIEADPSAWRKNPSFRYNVAGTLLAKAFPSNASLKSFMNVVKRSLPEGLRPIAARAITKSIPPMTEQDRQYVLERLRGRNAILADLIGMSLDHWQT
jgi:hypothetical protein